jgi:pimeloyl-ACP methyl ester carboxylesterase
MKFIVQGFPAYCYTANKPIKPDQPTLVFIHGAAMDHSVWQWQSRYFANHGYNVLAVDLPSHGQSPGNLRTSIEKLADWVIALLDCAQIERASLIGHSMGSLVALDAAARYGNRVSKLALLGTSLPMPVNEPFLSEAKADSHAGVMMQTVWGHAPAARLAQSPAPGSSLLGATQALIERSEPGAQGAGLGACNAYAPTFDLRGVEQAALIVTGKRDMMTPAKMGNELAKQLPNATVASVSAGHSMMSEAPNEVLDVLRAFLQ